MMIQSKLYGNIQKIRIKSLIDNKKIQGSSADITKISAVLIFKWIKEQNLQKIVLFCNQVHDENILECPESMGELVASKVQEFMVQAGAIYCKRVPLKAEAVLTHIWHHQRIK